MSRMVFRERRSRREVMLNVTSLVDVLFLLLIFFMLTGTFKRVGEMELRLPASSTSVAESQAPPHEVELILQADGDLLLDGKPVALAGLRGRLDEIHRQDAQARVMLKADENATHGQVIRVVDVVRDAGFGGIGIGTEMKQ